MERSLSCGSWVVAMFPGKKEQKKFLGTVSIFFLAVIVFSIS